MQGWGFRVEGDSLWLIIRVLIESNSKVGVLIGSRVRSSGVGLRA